MDNVKYPGIPTTGDGSEAAVWVETHVSQAAVTYPITPSTNMGYGYQERWLTDAPTYGARN
jgi:pyruvate-ferredoxin/flavodoxin oxidoreductase